MRSSSSSSSSSSGNSTCDNSFSGNVEGESYHLACNTPKKKAGRKKFKETRHLVYRGVRQRKGGKWVCEIREPHKKSRIWRGTFPCLKMAARAYDIASIALRGRSTLLNFADSIKLLPQPASTSAADIQATAIVAAEAFRPNCQHHQNSEDIKISMPTINHSAPLATNSRQHNHREGDLTSPSSSASEIVENSATPAVGSDQKSTLFIDEEAVFNMPTLLASMAEGMLLAPPAFHQPLEADECNTDEEDHIRLWSY